MVFPKLNQDGLCHLTDWPGVECVALCGASTYGRSPHVLMPVREDGRCPTCLNPRCAECARIHTKEVLMSEQDPVEAEPVQPTEPEADEADEQDQADEASEQLPDADEQSGDDDGDAGEAGAEEAPGEAE